METGTEDTTRTGKVRTIKVSQIRNAKASDLTGINGQELLDLYHSIKERGLERPVTVREKDRRFDLIDGKKRVAVFKVLNRRHILANVINEW